MHARRNFLDAHPFLANFLFFFSDHVLLPSSLLRFFFRLSRPRLCHRFFPLFALYLLIRRSFFAANQLAVPLFEHAERI